MTAASQHSSAAFAYDMVAPLDWFQWRCLLWDHYRDALDAADARAWQAIAEHVNAACPASVPSAADDYERAFDAVRPDLPDAASGLEIWTRSLYQQVPRLLGAQPPFMNLGFAGGNTSLALDAGDEPFRLHIQLYERALGGRRLNSQSVLECGCGGGGGLRYLAKYHEPALAAGIDLLPWNIDACRSYRGVPSCSFEVADAARLPFPDASFDSVISIESSGHYDCPSAFFRETARVLRPGGTLYLADLRPIGQLWGEGRDLASSRHEIAQAGLKMVDESDISEGVLRSIALQEDGRRQFLDGLALDPASRAHFDEIMLMRGSRNFRFLADGELRYIVFVCEKSSAGGSI